MPDDSAWCLVIADSRFLWTENKLWMDNLYIRIKTPIRSHGGPEQPSDAANSSDPEAAAGPRQDRALRNFQMLRAAGKGAKLYMTNVTLQVRPPTVGPVITTVSLTDRENRIIWV